MTGSPTTLDPIAEAAVLTSCGRYKNLVVGSFNLIGDLDLVNMKRALNLTMDRFPRLMSGVKEIWRGGRFRHVWESHPHLRPVLRTSELKNTDGSRADFDSRIQHVRSRLEIGRDVFQDVASEWHLVKVAQNRHILLAIVHHAAADGEVMAEIGKELLANYHELSTGNAAEWAGKGYACSTRKRRKAKQRRRKLREVLFGRPHGSEPAGESTALVSGAPLSDFWNQYLVKTVLSPEESDRLLKESKAMGLSFVDRLVVCAHLTVDRWNAEHQTPTSTIRTSISVNIRHRFSGEDNANHLSYLYFDSTPWERSKPADFSRTVARSRVRQFRNHDDIRLYQQFRRKMDIISVFPFSLRQSIVRSSVEKNLSSAFQINLMGVIWPEWENGRPTVNSRPVLAGDIEIAEVDAFGYKPATPMATRMWVYIYRNKLNFVLAWHLGEAECKPFMDIFMNNLLDFPMQA